MTDLVKQGSTELAQLSDFGSIEGVSERPKTLDPNDKFGTEDIRADEIRFPRLVICQALTPQFVKQTIPNLRMFDLFNDGTDEIYGKGPLRFIPLKRSTVRIEFDPTDQTKILDRNVPVNDPRLFWENDKPPRATSFTEFACLLLIQGKKPQPIVISIKETNKYQRRAAERLTGFIKFQDGPIYSAFKTVSCGQEKQTNGPGTFGVYEFANAGFIPKDTPAGAALYNYVKEFSEELASKTIDIQREPGDETGIDNGSHSTGSGGVIDSTAVKDEIPI